MNWTCSSSSQFSFNVLVFSYCKIKTLTEQWVLSYFICLRGALEVLGNTAAELLQGTLGAFPWLLPTPLTPMLPPPSHSLLAVPNNWQRVWETYTTRQWGGPSWASWMHRASSPTCLHSLPLPLTGTRSLVSSQESWDRAGLQAFSLE